MVEVYLTRSVPAIGKTSDKVRGFWPGRICLAYEELLMLRQGECSGITGIGRITEDVARKATAGVGGKLSQAMVDGKCRHGGPVLTGRLVEDMGKVRGDRFLAED
jgi:hypothetical protein